MAIIPTPAQLSGLRERKKLATREALSWAAMRLAVERGLENVTVPEIADAVGVSPRTFNNYFGSKYEAIAAIEVDRAARATMALLERPDDEPLWDALTEVAAGQFDQASQTPDAQWLANMRLVLESPRMEGEILRARSRSRQMVAEAIGRRLGMLPEDLYPQLAAGAVTVASENAIERWWNADPPTPLEPLIRQAMLRFAEGMRQPLDSHHASTASTAVTAVTAPTGFTNPPSKQGAPMSSNTLAVPGARLYYEVRGTAGPTLVLVPGGNGDLAPFVPLATALADRFRVVTYERRGFARSPLDGVVPSGAERLNADADDLRAVIEQLGDGGPVHVLGSSSGAIVALEFAARYPEVATTVIGHEPPFVSLLPEADTVLAAMDEAYETYQRDGLQAGMARFAEAAGLQSEMTEREGEPPQYVVDMMNRIGQNMAFWFEHELRSYTRAEPDLAALNAAHPRIARGTTSAGTLANRTASALAERMDVEPITFAGGHSGYGTHPEEFAATLLPILDTD